MSSTFTDEEMKIFEGIERQMKIANRLKAIELLEPNNESNIWDFVNLVADGEYS